MTFSLHRFRTATTAGLVAFSLIGAAAPAMAQTDTATFDLVLKGIRAGSLHFTGVQNGNGYSVVGKLESGGLVALLRKVRYDAKAQGRVSKGSYTPSSYTEKADTGKRQSESVMAYVKGVPQVKVYNPPRAPKSGDVDPASMGGTIDPLTALYATLRDVEPGQECNSKRRMYDGRHSTQIVLGKPQMQNGKVVCAGEYRRLAGFSDKEMAEKTRFPFVLTYALTAEGKSRVVEVSTDTIYGKGRLTRR